VEEEVDKSSMCGKILFQAEKHALDLLLGALNVEENFSRSNAIKFSWDNRCQDNWCILARLDRMYSFEASGGQSSPVVEYFIKRDSNHSDHLPV